VASQIEVNKALTEYPSSTDFVFGPLAKAILGATAWLFSGSSITVPPMSREWLRQHELRSRKTSES